MLSFSLIVATVNRTTELETLFESFALQAYPNLECLVIDQNPDLRVKKIVERWQQSLNLKVLNSAAGLSRARNTGLASATGDIVAFPDDDCWYSPELLANVSDWFEAHPEYSLLTVGAKDHDGQASGNRWIRDRCEIRPSNAFRTTFSSTIFVRRTAVTRDTLFDETLGAGSGTRFGSGEETDYTLNLLSIGAKGYFDRTWHIGHPKRDMLSGTVDSDRAAGYGAGMGHVLRKRSQPMLGAAFVTYDLLRSMLVATKGDFFAAKLCLRHAQGIMDGFFSQSSVLTPVQVP